jgi:hypothetical protein
MDDCHLPTLQIANLLGVKFGGKTHQIYTTKEKKSQNFPIFLWEK